MKHSFLLMILFAAGLTCAAGDELRVWRNAAGTSSFQGTLLSHDSGKVTIRRVDGNEFTLELGALHADDREWLTQAAEGPPDPATAGGAGGANDGASAVEPSPNAVFDTLCFGDSRQAVEDKLKKSQLVEMAVDETFLGRLGLNDAFRTRQDIGGLRCLLAFNWSAGGTLNEITLHTDSLEPAAYDGHLKNTWKELSKLMTTLHGQPLQAAPMPQAKQLQDGMFLSSHLWRLPGGGSALLGPTMKGSNYAMVVRFTTEKIEPVRIP